MIGSLFSGYGGLDMAVSDHLGLPVAWHCDNDPDASRVLAHHYPDTPNLGDITAVNWSAVPPVTVLTGGFPCTDVSLAGRQAGLRDGTRSGLWSHMAAAINTLRPSLVVIENVRGLASAPAHSNVEPCPWCVGDQPDGALRALGAVLGDLADLGYDTRWCGVRAADVGAPHGRFRIFIVAAPTDTGCGSWSDHDPHRSAARGRRATLADPDRDALRQQPVTITGRGGPALARGSGSGPAGVALLPTPQASDPGFGLPSARLAAARFASGRRNLDDAVALLPTPTATDWARNATANRRNPLPTTNTNGWTLADVAYADTWGDYTPAIQRWTAILGRPAPTPTVTGARGGRRLNAALSEWMMGLPDGWLTAVPGVDNNAALARAGNGVCPQQAALALQILCPIERVEAAA